MLGLLKEEGFSLIALLACIVAYAAEPQLLGHGSGAALIAALVLVTTIIGASVRVAHHAEVLAHRVGEPFGTMILTLSAVIVEVVILAIMMTHHPAATLVRDTIYAAVMLDINGIIGLAALLGGFKHGEQPYNDDSARTYGVMILTAMAVSMVVPEFVPARSWHIYSGFTIAAMLVLYGVFLRMQVGPHSYFFSYSYPEKRTLKGAPAVQPQRASTSRSVILLCLGLVLIGALAEVMSKALEVGLEGSAAPPMVAAILVAAISASPEILTALRAALANRMQSVVNIALGASLSTVILTVSVMEAIALFTGQPFEMAMTPVQTVMVGATLLVAAINLNNGETNAIEGMTHFVLFGTFVMLSLLGL